MVSQFRQSIAGIAHKARQVYSEANAAFHDANWREVCSHEGDDYNRYDDEEAINAEDIFLRNLDKLIVMITAGLEAIGADRVAKNFQEELGLMKKKPMASEVHREDSSCFWSPLLLKCSDYLIVLEAAGGDDVLMPAIDQQIKTLERILNSTGKILTLNSTSPTSEKVVYDLVANHLEVAFPSFTRSLSFNSPLKHYKPEFGVGELQAVVEYKLAKTKKEVPTRIDELATDVCGYRQNDEWKRFYAVIHMTDVWFTQDDVESQVTRLRFPDGWKVIVTHNGGGPARSNRP